MLVGKAREIYSALPVEISARYDEVRKAILKAYELVPEAYRQRFRNARKQGGQTYVEFARDKEALLDRWCTAKQVDNDFRKLRQLLLVEEFKKCLESDVKMYLDEQKADNLHQAAVLADDYSLTHKTTFPSKFEKAGDRLSTSDHRNSETGGYSTPITRSRAMVRLEVMSRILECQQVDQSVITVRNVVTSWLNATLLRERMLLGNLML